MTKTNELKKALVVLLKEVLNNVYFETAEDDALYPYLVYDLKELFNEDGKTVYELECNLIDNSKSKTSVDELADLLQKNLHNYYFINQYIQFTIYKLNKYTIKEKNKKITRRRLTFEIQLHELIGG